MRLLFQPPSSESTWKNECCGSSEYWIESNTKNSASGPKYAVSAIPVDLRYATARLARLRGSREYDSCVIGSITSHRIDSVGVLRNGSMTAVVGSGFISMSDEVIAFQPATAEPSNPKPSSHPSARRALRAGPGGPRAWGRG